jgi:hypothetical protein
MRAALRAVSGQGLFRWLLPVAALVALACRPVAPARETTKPTEVPAQPASQGSESRSDCPGLVADNEPAGLAAERSWLQEKFPGFRVASQSVGRDGERVLDLLVVDDADGARHEVCFDITRWFGKF